jgi:two-component system chemotaxis sensor kinase CheA
VTIRQTVCAVPLSSIVEITRFEKQDLKTVRGREVAMLRGDVLPILRMNEVFGWADEEKRDIAGKYVVVVKFTGTRVGLTVDVLLEQQELVVKSLDQIIGGSNSFSGASILGDGTVVLILDVASLIKGVVAERQSTGLAAISESNVEEE